MGLTTAADIEKYEADVAKRVSLVACILPCDYSFVCSIRPRQKQISPATTTTLPSDCSCVQERDASRPVPTLVVARRTVGGATSAKRRRNSPRLLLYRARVLPGGNCVCTFWSTREDSQSDCFVSSCAAQLGEQSLTPPPHARRTNALLATTHPPQAVSRHQGDTCTRVRTTRWQASAARSEGPRQDRRE